MGLKSLTDQNPSCFKLIFNHNFQVFFYSSIYFFQKTTTLADLKDDPRIMHYLATASESGSRSDCVAPAALSSPSTTPAPPVGLS